MVGPVLVYVAFGLVIGSFLNVCIYRIPRGQSIVFPRSSCPQCDKPIRAFDNIPVVSYVLLAGKCRHCDLRISPQYPLVEALTGLSFGLCALRWEFSPPTYVNSTFLAMIIVLVFIDYHHQLLPNVVTLPGMVLGLLLSPLQSEELLYDPVAVRLLESIDPGSAATDSGHSIHPGYPWFASLLGAVVAGGLLLLVGTLYQLLRKRQGLGMGDVKMMGMVGAFIGWSLALVTIFVGSILGSLVGVLLILSRGKNLQTRLPFGTFLGAAAALSLFYGIRVMTP